MSQDPKPPISKITQVISSLEVVKNSGRDFLIAKKYANAIEEYQKIVREVDREFPT